VFGPSTSEFQNLLNICCGYAVEDEIVFNCNKTTGVVCPLQTTWRISCFFKWPEKVAKQVNYLGVLLYFTSHWRMRLAFRGKWNHFIVHHISSESSFLSVLLQVQLETLLRSLCASMCVYPLCKKHTVWNWTHPQRLWNFPLSPGTYVLALIKLSCLSRHLIPYLETFVYCCWWMCISI